MRNLAANSPETRISRFEATRNRMKVVLPHADVAGYQASPCQTQTTGIVTWNLRDFPAVALRSIGLAAGGHGSKHIIHSILNSFWAFLKQIFSMSSFGRSRELSTAMVSRI
jgi:hypothetical protein